MEIPIVIGLIIILIIVRFVVLHINNISKENSQLINVTAAMEEDFIDLSFSIIEVTEITNGIDIKAKGLYKEDGTDIVLGFGIVINDKVSFYSLGQESNNFINKLSKLYGINGYHDFKKQTSEFEMIPLTQGAFNILTDYVRLKIFYDSNQELNLYSESYINVNIKEGIIEFFEKDMDYRKNIIKAFSIKK